MSPSPVILTQTWGVGKGREGEDGRTPARPPACQQAAGGAPNRNAAVLKITLIPVSQGKMKLVCIFFKKIKNLNSYVFGFKKIYF